MALKADKELKLYYSISEVAKMFGVNESLLRYWEKETTMNTAEILERLKEIKKELLSMRKELDYLT